MKFLSFIASTMLIVLISQHSITGLPVTDAPVEDHCLEGFELVDGHCEPIRSTTMESLVVTLSDATVTLTVNEKTPSENLNACPPGTHRDEHGECQQIQSSESATVNAESTTSAGSTVTITRAKDILVTDPTVTEASGKCAEGQRHGKYGLCEDIKTSETTTVNAETTSDDINLMGCPGGLKRGDDGFCPEINPINRTASVNLKGLLKPDGSCPDNYVKVKGRCLFVRPEPGQSLNGDDSNSARPRIGKDEVNNSELVPVEDGNLCPKGTENFSTGLCRKLPASSDANVDTNGDRICPSDYDSIDGNCIPKDIKDGSRLTTPTTERESTTRGVEEPAEQNKVPESKPEIKSTTERSKVTGARRTPA